MAVAIIPWALAVGIFVRHWQMIEAGRSSTLLTLLRICDALDIQQKSSSKGFPENA